MKLYNSLTRKVELFDPSRKQVSLYVCGITPYDTTHLGHAFTYTSADILVRYLEYQGLTVNYVQNVTDIDDDILRKAKEIGEDWKAIGDRWTRYFINDMIALNVRPPDFFPRATDVIEEIIGTVEKLLEAGVAYESGGSVYFNIHAWADFGKLSQLPYEEMLPIANERGNRPDDANKRDPLDFVLWQAQGQGEPAWESPWGPGRPGWHIECSTMATKYLGHSVDIHSGGSDLCFPHHECEIAQVEPVTGDKPFVRKWMHVAMVRHEGEKMSKSLGNLIMVRDLLEEWSPDGLRLYLGAHHYRVAWSYNVDELEEAEGLARRISHALSTPGGEGEPLDPAAAIASFTAAMDDDLNTPTAIRALENLADSLLEAAQVGREIKEAQESLRSLSRVFGLQAIRGQPEERVVEGWNEHIKRF